MRSIHALLVLAALALVPDRALADLSTGLIAHWPFDGNASDVSGNNNHGTLVNAVVSTTDRFGRPNHAYEFNGINTYVQVPNSASLASPTNKITMSAWVLLYGNSKVGSPFSPILMKSLEGGNGFMYRFHMSTAYFGCAYNDWNLSQATGATLSNQWAHIAITYDGVQNRYYLNGAFVDSTALAVTMTPDTRALTIGADFPGFFEVFWGKIDELRLYNRTLGPAEIQQLATENLDAPGGAVGVTAFSVGAAAPNPTQGACAFDVLLPEAAEVDVAILDVAGRVVRTLAPGILSAGRQKVAWDGLDRSGSAVAPGLYFASFRTPLGTAVTRVMRMR